MPASCRAVSGDVMWRRFSPNGQLPTTPVRIMEGGITCSGGGMRLSRKSGFFALWGAFVLLSGGRQDPPRPIELSAVATYSLPNLEVSAMALKDVNGDGFPDLFCACSAGGDETTSVMYLSVKGRFDQ